jgi:hypothetical protein
MKSQVVVGVQTGNICGFLNNASASSAERIYRGDQGPRDPSLSVTFLGTNASTERDVSSLRFSSCLVPSGMYSRPLANTP